MKLNESQEHHVTVSRKKARRKRGLIYLLLGGVCFAVNYLILMYVQDAARTQETLICTGGIGALSAAVAIIFLVGGVIYLILGFVGRE